MASLKGVEGVVDAHHHAFGKLMGRPVIEIDERASNPDNVFGSAMFFSERFSGAKEVDADGTKSSVILTTGSGSKFFASSPSSFGISMLCYHQTDESIFDDDVEN